MIPAALTPDEQLAEFVGQFYADPLGFVLACYPWGEPGPLQDYDGPDQWQREHLTWIGQQVAERGFDGVHAVSAIRSTVSSGHGIGKSTEVAWIIDWLMSTRPHCKITVTANTFHQLQTKTWAAVQLWTSRCLTSHWFTINSDRIYHTANKASWFTSLQSSSEENSEAFAGQHALDSSSVYIVDEASAVPDAIFEVAEGGLTDGEPMIFLFGNATRSSGKFHRVTFGAERERWHQTIVDSRLSRFTNKTQIEEWAADYGEDSDFFRVRVRGLAPNASDAQFIDQKRVADAQTRQVVVMPDEPLVAGCDLAWGGSDHNVIRFRRGRDARTIPAIRIPGEFTRDPGVLTNRLADVLTQTHGGHKVSMLFLDSAGIAGAVGTRLRELGHRNVLEVNFGADSPNDKRRYMRDHMWAEMKDWLLVGAIDKTPRLESDLVGPGLRPDRQQRIWLESKEDMKKRGIDSPDDGDALALTFAQTVRKKPAQFTAPVMPARGGPMGWSA